MSNIYIQTEALYAAVYDDASPANVSGFVQSEMDAARQELVSRATEERLAPYYLDKRLIACAWRGEMLAWSLPLNGVFKIALEFAPALRQGRNEGFHLEDVLPHTADLTCRSGRLRISCISKLGVVAPVIASVQPGDYRISLLRNEQEEGKHQGLRSDADYPVTDGPDWVFTIQRLLAK